MRHRIVVVVFVLFGRAPLGGAAICPCLAAQVVGMSPAGGAEGDPTWRLAWRGDEVPSFPVPPLPREAESEGRSRFKAALVGGSVGLVVGGVIVWDVLEVDSDSEDPFSDSWYLIDGPDFWKAVGIGAAVGALAGAIIGGTAFGPYRSGAATRRNGLEALPLVGQRHIGAVVRWTRP